MEVSDLNPHIRYARVHKGNSQSKKDFSKCYDCRIFFFNNVFGSIIINGEKYNILNKTAIYLPPKTEYRLNLKFKENGNIIVLNFDLVNEYKEIKSSLKTATKEDFDESMVPEYEILPELLNPIVRLIPQIERRLMGCTENFILKKPFYRENSSALVKLCLLEFIKESTELAYSNLCEEVLSYIHENYSSITLTNEEIAEKFNYHPYHLSRLIKQETGKTLHKYLVYYRLQIAKDFLITTRYDISEIAWRTGFCSAAYFIKTFRENVGMTPKEYRNLQIHTEI